jgi:aryl-alcohol dehydrogenase-like predicted oxidoreductase
MGKKQISRKEFVAKTLGGIAGINMISEHLTRGGLNAPELRSVGKTGIKVTPLCFGATRTNEGSLIKYVIDKGINFIDTGRAYSNGNNEILVGQAIAGIRKNIIIQSKIQLQANELTSKGKGKKGAEEIRSILSSKLEASLKALNTDYIEIMLYHSAVDENLLFHPEVLKFFSEMKNKGVLKACGFSTHNENMNLLQRNNLERFYDTIMVPFNLKGSFVHSLTGQFSEWDQPKLISILSEAGEKGIGVVAMKTCSGGKYSPSPDIAPSFKEAVNWVLRHEFISSAAVAMANFEQVDEYTKTN